METITSLNQLKRNQRLLERTFLRARTFDKLVGGYDTEY